MRIRKAVFPVAGLGTRFLPATKANAKEMLPVVDKPLIQYAVNEAISAGAEELVFITGRNKNSILDHFDKSYELEVELEDKGKLELLRVAREILPPGISCVYIRQAEALGLGHAVKCAWSAVGNEDFSVILADDLIDGRLRPCMAQMQQIYQEYGSSVLAVQRVPWDETHRYGIVEVEPVAERVGEIRRIVEKPKPEDAPSNLAVVGRYILSPESFACSTPPRAGRAARSSSPTPSPSCSRSRPCSPTSSRARALTAAASSATCRPTSSTGSNTPSSPRTSATTCAGSSRTGSSTKPPPNRPKAARSVAGPDPQFPRRQATDATTFDEGTRFTAQVPKTAGGPCPPPVPDHRVPHFPRRKPTTP